MNDQKYIYYVPELDQIFIREDDLILDGKRHIFLYCDPEFGHYDNILVKNTILIGEL